MNKTSPDKALISTLVDRSEIKSIGDNFDSQFICHIETGFSFAKKRLPTLSRLKPHLFGTSITRGPC